MALVVEVKLRCKKPMFTVLGVAELVDCSKAWLSILPNPSLTSPGAPKAGIPPVTAASVDW